MVDLGVHLSTFVWVGVEKDLSVRFLLLLLVDLTRGDFIYYLLNYLAV